MSTQQITEARLDPTKLTDQVMLDIRGSMDKVSWNSFNATPTSGGSNILKITPANEFLIKSFDSFITTGILSVLTSKKFKLYHGWLKITGVSIDSPRNNNDLLWPHECRIGKLTYSGSLYITGQIEWDPSNQSSGLVEVVDLSSAYIELAKIPIMSGSNRCNLSSIQTEEELNAHHESSQEYRGYFIVKGNARMLISQNYRTPNDDIVITSKMGITTIQTPKIVSNIRSKANDWTMYMLTVFVMTGGPKKFTHTEKRIYTKLPVFKQNVYGVTSGEIFGLNAVSLFRLANILGRNIDPFIIPLSYSFTGEEDPTKPQSEGGFNGVATFNDASRKFRKYITTYAGPEFGRSIESYIVSTINEASLESTEKAFWKNVYITCSSVEDKAEREKALGQSSLPVEGRKILYTFGTEFLPHISTEVYSMQIIHMEKERSKMRNNIAAILGMFNDTRNGEPGITSNGITNNFIDTTLNALGYYIDYLRKLGRMPEGARLGETMRHEIILMAFNNNEADVRTFTQIQTILLQRHLLTDHNNPIHLPNTVPYPERESDDIRIETIYIALRAKQYYNKVLNELDDKLKMVSYMAVRVLRVELGYDSIDDRDSLAHQMYEDAGYLMTSRFAAMVKEVMGVLAGYNSRSVTEIVKKLTDEAKKIITMGYESNFAEGKWNSAKADKPRTGVTDLMPTSVVAAHLAALRRVAAQSKTHNQNTTSREITGLQPGYICPTETPEGKQTGNIKHFATFATVTNLNFDATTFAVKINFMKSNNRRQQFNPLSLTAAGAEMVIKEDANLISLEPKDDKTTPLFLNGRPQGWVNGIKFRKHMIQKRRDGYIHPQSGIHYKQKITQAGMFSYLKITTTAGRLVQPLIIIKTDPLETLQWLIDIHLDYVEKKRYRSLEEMVAEGNVEYIDPAEMEFLDVAPSISDFMKAMKAGQPQRYDHIMLNPAFLVGITANIMPFAGMNPPVRNSYFTQMGKQTSDIPDATFVDRPYTAGISRLYTPQDPIVKTDMYDVILNGNNQMGMNLYVMINPERDGEEDGIVVSERFIENGCLASAKISSYKIDVEAGEELNFGGDFMDTVPNAGRYAKGIIRTKVRTPVVDPETGETRIINKAVEVDANEIIARKMKINKSGNIDFTNIYYESLRAGTVAGVITHKGPKETVHYINIKNMNDIIPGDKISSRYSQKGIIVKIIPTKDMPYDITTGETADIILNPQAFPSRMTIGMAAEMLVGTAYVTPDPYKTIKTQYERYGIDVYAALIRVFIVSIDIWKQIGDNALYVGTPGPTGLINGRSITTKPYAIITSEEVSNEPDLQLLMANDVASIASGAPLSAEGQGIYAFTVYDEVDRKNIRSKWPKLIIYVNKSEEDPVANELTKRFTTFMTSSVAYSAYDDGSDKFDDVNKSGLNRLASLPFIYQTSTKRKLPDTENLQFEQIPNIWMDSYHNIPIYGVKVSNLPNGPSDNYRDRYLNGNANTTIPTQYMAGYLPHFFKVNNLIRIFMNFTIPEDMRILKNLYDPESKSTYDFELAAINWFNLDISKDEVQYVNEDGIISKSTNIKNVWLSQYGITEIIDPSYVIDLPPHARGVYERREERMKNLRYGTIFKEGLNTEYAKNELEMLGMHPDAKRTMMDPVSGREITNGIVMGWSFYMPLKHKVKDKVQARGEGKKDAKYRQPNKGRINGGGIRFNKADCDAVIKSGASSVVADRMHLAAGLVSIYICQACGEKCNEEARRDDKLGAIICPICKCENTANKVDVPYPMLVLRSLMMAVGVRYRINTKVVEGYNDD